MRHRRVVVASVAAIAACLVVVFAWSKWRRLQRDFGPSAEFVAHVRSVPEPGGALPILWSVPAFSYLDQHGRNITDRDLRGHIWISDFFFTRCTSICPMMTAKMAGLQKAITLPDVRFISFSVDPEHDTPAVLREYAKMWKADDRWHFLATEPKKLADTAAGMRVFVRPPDKDTPIQHTGLFLLTDAEGNVRGVYDHADKLALDRLTIDAMILAGKAPAQAETREASTDVPELRNVDVSPGGALYASRGCLACHSQGQVAPPLAGCLNRKVMLSDGTTVTSDEQYLRESILKPAAKVVAGYPNLMPAYAGELSETELEQLIAHLKSLQASGNGDAAAPATPVDPVCKMAVDVDDNTPQAEFDGKRYYFCSPVCRTQFLKDPAKFTKPAAQ